MATDFKTSLVNAINKMGGTATRQMTELKLVQQANTLLIGQGLTALSENDYRRTALPIAQALFGSGGLVTIGDFPEGSRPLLGDDEARLMEKIAAMSSPGTPPAPPGPAFAYAPASATIQWIDNGGGHTGDLAFFNANANKATVNTVTLDSQSLTSISHISDLSALTSLSVTSNDPLTSVDCSGCSSLQVFDCSNASASAKIALVTLTGCTNLLQFTTDNNPITSVSFADCPNLTSVSMSGQICTSLDFSMCHALDQLSAQPSFFYGGSTTSLNLAGCAQLTQLNFHDQSLTTLNLSSCIGLSYCDLGGNTLLTHITQPSPNSIQTLIVTQTGLTSLNVSSNNSLTLLWAYNSPALASIVVTGCSALSDLEVESTAITTLDLTGCNSLVGTLDASSCSLSVAAVNAIFIFLDGIGLPNGVADTSNQSTPAIPTGAGADAVTDLQGQGWTISVDS